MSLHRIGNHHLVERGRTSRNNLSWLLAALLAVALASGCAGATGGGGSGSNLTVTPSTVSFGDVITGGNGTRSVTVTNAGTLAISIDKVSISGAGFSVSGVAAGQILAPGGTAVLTVTFAPSSTGKVTGTATLTAKDLATPLGIALTGNGVAAVAHSVTLTWNASTSSVTGYRAYRATSAGGPYTSLNPAPNPQLRWTDSTVQPGVTYYYVVTAVAGNGTESTYSAQASAAVPKP
jgi:hypothetical protein